MTEFVLIGLPTSPHGVQGWIKVAPMTDVPNRFSLLKSILIQRDAGSAPRPFDIEGVKYQAERVLLKLKGIDTREQADALRGHRIVVLAEQVPPIEEKDTYYTFQLSGMSVMDRHGGLIGTLEEIYPTGGNDIYLVRTADGKTEYFVPAIKKCILSVDVERKIMVVDREFMA